ncbi:pyruvate dehydrogenase complex dihydrolipoamide acetyltransferase [Phenylobacterium deserti]|uniref:Acetyltransferase component of pyruvate dehydrogenase complex n=1 Tax=Phenylobacterium deserti TaxID=1914756 RepID=A0A328AE97_9CAUL|nr:pyruvate dehydrogenase complex dihydrolipoamide acetyltransferase [Phenylobacterium deserti]RAK52969.1 pyruvate dehydrogenase complex dihydrolipoamide acetyltransferase [Phenylobacterium deserti]
MPIDVLMPALSPTMEEGTLAKWHVKPGDQVRSGDVIAEIETDKATMEVEAVDEGTVEEILVAEGTEGVKVNSPIARLSGDDASTGAAPAAAPAPASTAPAKPTPDTDNARAQREQTTDPVAKGAPAAKTEAATPAPAAAKAQGGQRIFASPLARRLAEQKGVELSAITGTGPHGRIVKVDVDKAQPGQAKAPAAAPTPAAAPQAAPAPAAAPAQVKSLEQLGIAPGTYDLIPLDGMRKTVARRLTESFRDIPHFPLTVDLEIDELLATRVKINAMLEKQGVKVSVNDLVMKAVAAALKQVPEANASYTPEGIAMHHHADIAMAVALEGGLITPIIRKAETKGVAQIATEAKDLAARARARKLKPDEFQGGTFSVSNLGMFGIKTFSSIINEPQGCILSVGAGEKRPVVKGDQLAIATVMTVTLTCDHRVVDGAVGARWLQAFKALIEDPITMIV